MEFASISKSLLPFDILDDNDDEEIHTKSGLYQLYVNSSIMYYATQ